MFKMSVYSADTNRQSTSPLTTGIIHRLQFYLVQLPFQFTNIVNKQ